jgi:hypothetical protein
MCNSTNNNNSIQCLDQRNLIEESRAIGSISETAFQALIAELDDFKLSRKANKSYHTTSGHVMISMLSGGQFEVPISEATTVKDLKVFLGLSHQGRDPRSFRLLFNGLELKV